MEKQMLLEFYRMVIPETVKYYMVKMARDEKVYGASYIPRNTLPIEECIAKDCMRIAKTLVEEYEKELGRG